MISPSRVPSASTSGSFLIFCGPSSPARHPRARSGRCGRPASRRGVMRSATRSSPLTKRTSRSVSSPSAAGARRRPPACRRRCPPCGGVASETVRVVADGVRVGDDAVLRPLDGGDLGHLRRDVAGPEPAVDDADAAFLGQHDRHRRPRDGVHVGRTSGRFSVTCSEKAVVRSMAAGSRLGTTPSCGVNRKSSNVQPRTNWNRSMKRILPGCAS